MTSNSIVFLNRFYWPDVAATGQMLTDLAEDLSRHGWNVTVVTSDSAYDSPGSRYQREEYRNGVRILRVKGTRFGRQKKLGRVVDYVTYLLGAVIQTTTLGRPAVIVAMSDPPFVLAVALLCGRLTGARVVYWVQDLFPQIAARLGVLREKSALFGILRSVARSLQRRCDLVIALGPRMAQALVESGAPPDRTTFVHNWADTSNVVPIQHADNPFRKQHGLDGKFVVLYSGNAGRAHTFDSLVRAIRSLRQRDEIVFQFVGGGARMKELQIAAAREDLRNMRFLEYVPRSELANSLSAGDVSLVTEDPSVIGLLVPSKTYGILASGRPLLFIGSEDSDVARVVRDSEAGVVVDPNDDQFLVTTITALQADSVERNRLAKNARLAAEESYGRSIATSRWHELVKDLIVTGPVA